VLIDWFTVLAQIVNFLILIFLLKRFLYGPIIKAMAERERKIADAMDQAKKAEKEASQRSMELAQEKRALLDAKEKFMAEAKKEVEAWREKTLKESRVEVDKLRQSWLDRLNQDKQVFFEKLKERVVSKVLRISEKVLRDLANEDLENQVISVFLEKVEGDKERFQFEDTTGQVLIQSGFEPGAEHAENLRRRIGKWFPETRAVQFEVADELGLGLQLIVDNKKVAWHLADYLKNLEKGILEDLPAARRELP